MLPPITNAIDLDYLISDSDINTNTDTNSNPYCNSNAFRVGHGVTDGDTDSNTHRYTDARTDNVTDPHSRFADAVHCWNAQGRLSRVRGPARVCEREMYKGTVWRSETCAEMSAGCVQPLHTSRAVQVRQVLGSYLHGRIIRQLSVLWVQKGV